MDAKIKKKWVAALRSGKYRQTRNQLYDGQAYCCLGVLCRVVGVKSVRDCGEYYFKRGEEAENATLPESLRKELKITNRQQTRLITLNDGSYKTNWQPTPFRKIADYIAKHL